MKRVKITLPEGGYRYSSSHVPIDIKEGATFEIEAEEIIIEGDVSLAQALAERIPFDLEAAKAGAAIVTRSGREVRFLAHVPEALCGAQVLAYIKGDAGAREFSESGMPRPHTGNSLDLFMAPKNPKMRYLNLRAEDKDLRGPVESIHFPTKEEAEEFAGMFDRNYWALIAYPITIK